MRRLIIALTAGLLLAGFNGGLVRPAAAETFPRPEVIQPNVSFWIKVYSEYPTTRAIVHDSINLGVVYEVIALKPYDASGARKINRQRMKRARAKYQGILKRLAADPAGRDPEARRVAALFGAQAGSKAFQQAASRVRCQIGQKDRFRAGLIRSGAYIDEIRAILKQYGVPADLAYLPHVESSFNPKAYSKFGAAGIWQFTRSTGKRFMAVGYEIDERRDPIRATHAAARLLKENHDRLGSWPLAITAYNHGAAGVARAKRKHGDYPAVFRSYRSRTFKFASRNFYSEFLAARQVAANHHQYFDALALDRPTPTQTVVLEGYARFADLQAHFGVDASTMHALNPALRAPVLNGQKHIPKGYHLRLPQPEGNAPEWAAIPEILYLAAQKPSRFYTVQRGDTAGRIARTHGVRLADLIAANNLNRRATIYPRQTLRLPLPDENVTLKPLATPPIMVADVQPAPLPPAVEDQAPPPAEPAATPPADELPSPTLASVVPLPPVESAMEKTAPAPAADLPVPSGEIVVADVRFERVLTADGQPEGLLQVEVEETLGHYAEWAGVRTQVIRRLNGLPFGRTLHLHQKVKVPLKRTNQAAFEEQRYEFHKRLQEDFFAVYRVAELETYHVRRGDSYWTLCRDKFGIPLWLLKHYNTEVDLADLRVRQKLIIPLLEKTDAGDPGTVTPDDPAAMSTEG
jgi:membrane-bound lytic murein transglycosylase D